MTNNDDTNNNKPTTTNPDLLHERSQATFTPTNLTNLLDGSPTLTTRRRQLESLIRLDPTNTFSNDSNAYLHRTERHVRALAKHVRLLEICRALGIGNNHNGEILKSDEFPILLAAVADDLPTALHWVMFVPNIVALCDEEQQAEWLPLCRDWRMVGCYAQTELGHGSNVRGLETTATFVPEGQGGGDVGGSFIINSPTLTSTKFWPGTLGRTANHAMVIARLIDGDNIDRGIHNFIVPLRSMKDHTPLPGVTVGDIGPKIGYNNMDNGFASFDNVKIPRRNMAMKFARIDENGKYTKAIVTDAMSKIAYITMMEVRAHIINESGKHLATACTIAIRYSAVRRQGFDETLQNGTETQILDYTQQQHRLFPLLAASYCFFFAGKKILNRLHSVQRQLTQDKSQSVTKTQVADLHASSSCLKSFCSTVTADGIEDCRKACGGHGFLQASGLPELLGSYLQNPTVEGDNYMLPQQAVRVLLKLVQSVLHQENDLHKKYDKCDSKYLIEPLQDIIQKKAERCPATTEEEMRDLNVLLHAFKHRTARLLLEVAQQLQQKIVSYKSSQQAWNESLVQMHRVSKAHSLYLLLDNFSSGIADARFFDQVSSDEISVLTDLALLFGLYWIEKDIGDFLEDSYFSSSQVRMVRNGVLHMLRKIRPNAVALVDARDISDFRLKSVLGRYDGNVYEAILESSKRDPLNAKSVGPGYEEHLKRMYVDGVGVSGTVSRL